MKNVMKPLRMALLGLLFSAASFAGSTTWNFTANTGSQSYNQNVDSGGSVGGAIGSNSFASAYLLFGNPGTGNGLANVSANTNGVSPGSYYLGTIPLGGDDIYVQIY